MIYLYISGTLYIYKKCYFLGYFYWEFLKIIISVHNLYLSTIVYLPVFHKMTIYKQNNQISVGIYIRHYYMKLLIHCYNNSWYLLSNASNKRNQMK